MGTTVTVTLDGQLKPNYTIATVLAPAFVVDVDELVLWIGNNHGAGYSFEITGIRKCLDKIRDFGSTTPASGKHSYAKLAAPGYVKDVSTGANVTDLTSLTGTVTVGAGTKAVAGTATTFTTDLVAGQTILIGTQYCVIDAITSDTALTITANHTAGATAADYSRVAYTDLSGTMTITAGTKKINGEWTAFDTELVAGTSVVYLGGEHHLIATITDAEDMDTTANHVAGSVDVALTGTVTVGAGSDAMVGVGTAFLTEVTPLVTWLHIGTEWILAASVADDENLVLNAVHTAGVTAATIYDSPTGELATPTLLTGTVSVTAGLTAVVGVGTTFTTDLVVGDVIDILGELVTVSSIGDANNLVIATAHVAGASGAVYSISNTPAEEDVGIWYGDLFQQTPGSSITPHTLRALEKYMESTSRLA